ncbi:PAAR domain-containing protein [Variovorax sp. RHLX14]|uniref:PAAR domain-containing protein n=1 Tax=Variovorax sp. RHLX14 TaxID=1259731 RepID=UPI003F48E280
MGKRFYIHVGDTTTSAGKVLTGLSTSTWHGMPNAFDGDAVECPKCGSVGQIRTVGSRISSVGSHGRQRALSGDLCLCKCSPPPRLVASQETAWTEGEAGDVVMAASAGTAAATVGALAGVAFVGGWRAGLQSAGDADPIDDTPPADQRFLVRDESTGQPVANRLYRLSYLGGLVQGRTDAQDHTEFVSGSVGSEIRIEVFGEDA